MNTPENLARSVEHFNAESALIQWIGLGAFAAILLYILYATVSRNRKERGD